ncbi:MAG: hypothetical protein FD189_2049 [Elusimicrobia bacterium]|nr:MAG: hypothetical protein FD154_2142 [Elusimicrobiota bacterium]KAF0154141.1 MAG: hypothetical protein FD189_2049 [Elusimicrobiota bacterium]
MLQVTAPSARRIPGRSGPCVRAALLAVLSAFIWPAPAHCDNGTEFGVADTLKVMGTLGTVPDPNLAVKGFSVFGSTNVQTFISTAAGNAVFNGAVQVSSDVYVTGRSTFTAPLQIWNPAGFSGNLLNISTGTSNVIRMTGAGEIYANKFYGDGTTLTGIVTNPMTSKLNINATPSLGTQNQAGISIDTHVFVTAGNVGIGTTAPGYKLDVRGGDLYIGEDLHIGVPPGGFEAFEFTINSGNGGMVLNPDLLT